MYKEKERYDYKMKKNKLLLLSLVSSGIVILYEFFKWKLAEVTSVFLILPVMIGVFGLFLVITVIALVALFKKKKWIPLVIQAATVILLVTVPFNKITLDIDFKWNKQGREKVVEMVKNGDLKLNEDYNPGFVSLPKGYKNLSSGNYIAIEKTNSGYRILFYTYSGVLDNFSGFLYTTEKQGPSKDALMGDIKEIDKLDKNWYFVASY